MDQITVIKRDYSGEVVWRYTGRMLERGPRHILLEAHFDRADVDLNGIVLATGDRFLETFYSDRWYNVFEIRDRERDSLKGWYCNIGRPAEIKAATVAYDDLAIDLLVFPDGRQVILDLEEFNTMTLPARDRSKALAALDDLQTRFRKMTAA